MDNLLQSVNDYYTGKIREHGISPKGVDWNSEESQNLRFDQLTKVINEDQFSLLDYGCGYGALLTYLDEKYKDQFRYTGFDISEEMIAQAKKANSNPESRWLTELGDTAYDYTIASGIFNVRLEFVDKDWMQYTLDTLDKINKCSRKGFAFNMLTSYSDKEYMRDYLYYADPAFIFDYCKKHYSKYVALLHDYPLYEFTIIVRK